MVARQPEVPAYRLDSISLGPVLGCAQVPCQPVGKRRVLAISAFSHVRGAQGEALTSGFLAHQQIYPNILAGDGLFNLD